MLFRSISPGFAIEGVYSNHKSDYTARYIWGRAVFKWKYYHPENADDITVKVEILNPKLLEFSFYKSDEYFGMKRLKGKFKNDSCFYSRRTFSIIPLFPLLFGYENEQKRVYHVDDELIIEITGSDGGGSIFWIGSKEKKFIGHDKFNDILRFKQIED